MVIIVYQMVIIGNNINFDKISDSYFEDILWDTGPENYK